MPDERKSQMFAVNDLKNLTDDALLARTKSLATEERSMMVNVIEHLKEIELRQLHIQKSYSSMFSFVTGYLGYSEAEAHVRIQAARLTQTIPQVTEKILTGELNLSVAAQAQAQAQFNRENVRRKEAGENPMRREEKQELLEMVSNCSRCQAEEKLNTYFAGCGRLRPSDEKEYKFTAHKDLELMIERLMDEYAHLNFNRDLGKLIEKLVKQEIAKIDKRIKGPEKKADQSDQKEKHEKAARASEDQSFTKRPRQQVVQAKPIKKSRPYISIHTKREIWKRTGKTCAFIDKTSGKRCCSTHGLEFDHIIPVSKGGTDDVDNLTILCDTHNRWKSNRVT